MPLPLAGGPRTTGRQCQGCGRAPNGIGTSTVYLALGRLKGPLRGKHVLVRTDNTATVAYINRQGGLRSRRMSQLARHLLLWSQKHLRLLRAIHVPGVLNRVADELSRAALPGEWRLHQVVQLIWEDPKWPRGLRKYAFPPVSLLAQTLCKVREDKERVLLVAPYWPNRTWFSGTHAPRDSPSLASSSEKGPSFSETGHPLAPTSRPLETPCLVPGRDAEVLGDLPPEVLNTISSARAPFMRRAYALKWNLFVKWCSSRREDTRRCSIGVVLSFLQQGLERRLSPSTLKVHAAAISACHDHINGKSIGKHDLVVRFLRGARRLNPPRPPSIPFCAQGSYHSLQGPGSEPASAAPGGGRPSPGFALSSSRLATIHRQNSKPQDLRPALCL